MKNVYNVWYRVVIYTLILKQIHVITSGRDVKCLSDFHSLHVNRVRYFLDLPDLDLTNVTLLLEIYKFEVNF